MVKSIIVLEVIILILATITHEIILTYIAISLSLFFIITSITVAFKSVFLARSFQ